MKLSYRIIYCPIRPIGLISPIISSIPEKHGDRENLSLTFIEMRYFISLKHL